MSQMYAALDSVLSSHVLQHNPLNATAYRVRGLTTKGLEAKYCHLVGEQTRIPAALLDHYKCGRFAKIPSTAEPMALVMDDGKINRLLASEYPPLQKDRGRWTRWNNFCQIYLPLRTAKAVEQTDLYGIMESGVHIARLGNLDSLQIIPVTWKWDNVW